MSKERLSTERIKELLVCHEKELAEQKDTIRFLEEQEGINNFAAIHRQMAEDCKDIIELIEELRQYRELEKQGLLLRLPCKVGDTVWIVGNEHICDYEVRRFILSEEVEAVQVAKNIKGNDYWNSFSLEEIGKTVFLTQSEAEEKLRELEGKKPINNDM